MEIEQLVVRMATENPRWGYRRIQGAEAITAPGSRKLLLAARRQKGV